MLSILASFAILVSISQVAASVCENSLSVAREKGNALLQKGPSGLSASKALVSEDASPVKKGPKSTGVPKISMLTHKNASLQENGSIVAEHRSLVDVSPALKHNASSLCFRVDYEYGNVEKGSCAWAPLVALHCPGQCLETVLGQDWFPPHLPTHEVMYEAAERCHEACLKTRGCEFWSFDTRPGTFEGSCWMKEAVECKSGYGDEAPGIISGPAKCTHASVKGGDFDTDMIVTSNVEDLPSLEKLHGARVDIKKSHSRKSHGTDGKQGHDKTQEVTFLGADEEAHKKSSWVPWLWGAAIFFAEMLGGGMCLAGAGTLVVLKYNTDKMQRESVARAEPTCVEERIAYPLQGHAAMGNSAINLMTRPQPARPSVRNEIRSYPTRHVLPKAQVKKGLADSLESYAVPPSKGHHALDAHEPEQEEVSFTLSPQDLSQQPTTQAHFASYDY